MTTNTSKRAASPLASTREKAPHLQTNDDDITQFMPLKSIYSPSPPRLISEGDAALVENRRSKVEKLGIGTRNLTPNSQAVPPQPQPPDIQVAVATRTSGSQPQAIYAPAASSAAPAIGPQPHHIVISDDATNYPTSPSFTNLNSAPVAARRAPSRRGGRSARRTSGARRPHGSHAIINAPPPSPVTPSTTQDQVLAEARRTSHQASQIFPQLADLCMHRIEANRALAKSTHEFHGRSVEYLDAQTVVNLRQAIAEQQTNVRTLDGAIDSLKGQLQAIMTEGLLLVLQPHGSLASKTEERFAQISTRLAPSEQATKTLSAETQDLARNVQELKTARANDAAKYEESNAALCLHLNLYERKMQDLTHGNIALAERVKDLTTTRGNDAARHEESTAALCSDLKLHERSIEKLTHENTALAEKVKELTAIHATDATKTATGFTQTSAHLGYLDEATTQATAETRMLKDKVQELSLSNSAQEGKINQLESDRNAMLKRMSKTEEDIAALHKTLVAQNEVLDKVISLKLPPDVVSSIELEALRKQVEGKWSTIYNRQAATTASLYKLEANVAKVCTTVEEDMLARANTAQVLLDRLQEISATQSEHHAQCQRSTAEAKEMFNTAAQEVMSQHEKVEADVVNKIVALELKVGKIEAGGDKIQNRMTPLEHGGAELQERYLHLEADTKAMRSQLTTLHSELRPSADTRVVSTSPRVINRIANLEDGIEALTRDLSHVIKGKRNYDVLDKEIKEIGSITTGLLATTRELEAIHRPAEKPGSTVEQQTAAKAQNLIDEFRLQREARLQELESAKHPVLAQLFDLMKENRDALEQRVNEIWGTLEGRLEALETVDVSARVQQLSNLHVNVQIVRQALQELETHFSCSDRPSPPSNGERGATTGSEHKDRLRHLRTLLSKHDDTLVALAKVIATCELIAIGTDMGCCDARIAALETKVSKVSTDHPKSDLKGGYHLRRLKKKTMASGGSTAGGSQPNTSSDVLPGIARLAPMQPIDEKTPIDTK